MIRLLGKLPGLLATAMALLCAATVAAQATGLAWAWSRGSLAHDKVIRYAGILYGLDPLDLEPPKNQTEDRQEPRTREEIMADRVRNTPILVERATTLKQTTDDLRSVTLMLRRSREKYMTARDGFESLLTQLEKETEDRSLRDLQITLESIAPKQAKDILREMLIAPNSDPTDNILGDVVSLLRTLPDDKLRKVLGEFKTDEERQLLHEILIEIGELDRPPGESPTTPIGGNPPAGTTGGIPTGTSPGNSSPANNSPASSSPATNSPATSSPATSSEQASPAPNASEPAENGPSERGTPQATGGQP